jgi:hypothetical protein
MGSSREDVNARLRELARQRGDDEFGRPRTQTGPTEAENLDNVTVTASKYGTTFSKSELGILRFPLDLEEKHLPYVLFKIFEVVQGKAAANDPTTASLRTGGAGVGNAATALAAAVPGLQTAAGAAVGAQIGGIAGGALVGGIVAAGETENVINKTGSVLLGVDDLTTRAKNLVQNFSLKRNIEQLALAIALFMPDGINTSYDNEYEALSVTATLGALGFGAQALASKGGSVDETNAFIAEAASSIAGRIVGNDDLSRLGVFGTTGRVINPQLEMLYTSPVLRKFTFDFRLIPRNEAESGLILGIINNLKYYAAPSIPDNSTGRYFIPPAQFEIEFYDGNNNQNGFLFKTKKCALSGINVDYSPNGFATFRNGAPVETRLQLTFQETVIIDRTAVSEGY